MKTRRGFLRTSAAGLGMGAGLLAARPAGAIAEAGTPTLAVFTKHLLGLDHERIADSLAEIGVTAIEAPIRPGGHVEPARVADDLPRFVEILGKRGISIAVLASGINAVAREQHAESVLRTAKSLGITRYRMNWYHYDMKRPLWPQLEAIGPRLDELVALSKEVGILPCYQNHSGVGMVGSAVWDMEGLMRKHPAAEVGWYFDIFHARVEGGLSWPVQAKLVRDRLAVASFKDFVWEGTKLRGVPLGQGLVGPEYAASLRASRFDGVASLFLEYFESEPRDAGYLARAAAATKRDLEVLRSWLS
ncbi:sugar phosphate isomerase/epimerase family protein [Aquisphaera insulae]|uniref:sugar phosphate isomerase/epimerase family protein n=1 Tax=Aquisphaera insulae TaxID=2712864 RepID=UPI0013ED242B|nr:TIM barrel protein [Aquisphaera insulae]